MKLQDYLHYFLGAKCTVVRNDRQEYEDIVCLGLLSKLQRSEYKRSDHLSTVKPHLHRLEDMTEEEGVGLFGVDRYWDIVCKEGKWDSFSTIEFHFLLKQGFDLFNLIDAGLAVDAKTHNQ